MKKFILAAIAATVALGPIAATVAEAQPYQRERQTTVVKRNGNVVQRTVTTRNDRQAYRHWRKGERFDRRYAQNYRQIDYRQYRGLRAPPRGYHYVRSGNDALLVGITSGVIAAVVAGAIR